MPNFRPRAGLCATLLTSAALSAIVASPSLAQSTPVSLSEQEAVARALGDTAFTMRGEAERESARAEADAVTRFENPRASVSRKTLSGPAEDETEWEAEFVQPLDLTGRRSALRGAADAEADAVDAEMLWRSAERAAEVRRAWTGCAAASAKAEATRRFVGRMAEAERIVTERASAGDTAVYDLRRVRVEARAAEAEARIAEGELTAECVALAHLTGVPDARAEGLAAPDLAVVAPGGENRADLAALRRRRDAAGLSARAAERSRWPEIEVGLGYRRVEALGIEADGPQISVGATIPLFDTGSARTRAAQAQARAREAELSLAMRGADADVAAADARTRAAISAVRAAEGTRDDASRLGAIAETAYQAGEIGVTELVDAYRAAHEAELSIIELTGRANLAAIELELAQGGPRS